MTTGLKKKDFLLQSPARIRSLLRTLMESHQLVSLNLDYTNASSISIVNEIAKDGRTFLLDGVRDTVVDKRIAEGASFSLTTSLDGVEIRIEKLRAVEIVGEAETLNYRAELPLQAYYFQRRQAFRAPVPDSAKISTSIDVPAIAEDQQDAVISDCRLTDLSASGCAITISESDGKILEEYKEPVRVSMKLQENDETIALSALIRHCRFNKRVAQWRIGIEFRDVAPATRQRIEQLNASLQLLDRQRNN